MTNSCRFGESSPALDASELAGASTLTRDSFWLDLLSELGRATTAYHEALPERFEAAREEYEEALRRFKASM